VLINHYGANMKNRLTSLINKLTEETVLKQWFGPMQFALDKVRYPDSVFGTLSMPAFLLLACLRQLQSHHTLREQVQALMHFDNAAMPPLARSTWSDALASPRRCCIARDGFNELIKAARIGLPERLNAISSLGTRAVIAIDASYQTESAHYEPHYPMQGGNDNQKGHMLMTFYDVRKGIPLDVKTETTSMGEMKVIKRLLDENPWMQVKDALYSVDRAFIDIRLWDQRKQKHQATMVTRFKSNTNYTEQVSRLIAERRCNEGVISDTQVSLLRSKQPWRRVEFINSQGVTYSYLSNDFTLEPGELAFIYHRRWDEEKYFDNYKNDLANTKAWGKSKVSIEQQAIIGMMTYILTRLFLEGQYEELKLEKGNTTQSDKHQKKLALYNAVGGIHLRAKWIQLSKIPLQVWRFLRNCFMKQNSARLYERQLRPLLMAYI
jgi:hypothetical protein